jgi:hypothetical protein
MNDLDTLRFYRYQVQPLLIHLYLEAKLEAPSTFDHKIEGPRLVATLREQGFSINFPIEDIVPTKNAMEKKS